MHRSTSYIMTLTSILNIGAFFFGYQNGLLNDAQKTMNVVLGINPDNTTLIALMSALNPIGALFGAAASSELLRYFSRRQALFIADIIAITGCSLSMFTTIEFFFAYRFIAGMAVGLNSSLVPLIVKEYSPVQIAGLTGSVNGLFINGGVFISYIVGLGYQKIPSSTNEYWRFAFMLPGVLSLLRSLLLLTVFKLETPLYYVSKDDKESAYNCIRKFYLDDSINKAYMEYEQQNENNKLSSTSYCQLLEKPSRLRLIVGCALALFQQFSGINAIVFYSTTIFLQSTNNNVEMAQVLTIGFSFLLTAMSGVWGFVSKWYGRKTILIFGCVIIVLSMIVLSISSFFNEKKSSPFLQYLTVAFIYIYTVGFGVSLGPIVWLYNAEILPDKGVAIATFFNWIGVVIITFLFPIMNNLVGISACFAFFGICTLVALIFIKVYVEETKGRTPIEIRKAYFPMLEDTSNYASLTDDID